MTSDEHHHTTVLLRRMAKGDTQAADELMPIVYDELRQIAERLMQGQGPSHTLQPTALIHEAFMKIVHVRDPSWEGRAHFMRVAARSMRSVLIDYARGAATHKRGGARRQVTLYDDFAFEVDDLDQVLVVHEGVEALAEIDEQLANLVELRFFGGFDNKEIADLLSTSLRSVERGWRFARAWLKQHFEAQSEGGE